MKRLGPTWIIFCVTIALMTLGLVMVYSGSAGIAARETLRKATVAGQLPAAAAGSAAAAQGAAGGTRIDAAAAADPATLLTSHSGYYLTRQGFWVFAGLVAMLLMYQVDYDALRRYAPWMALLALVLCLAVLVPGIGVARKGARRWIALGSFMLQPSELAKLAVLVYMARQLAVRGDRLRSFWRGFVPAMAVLALFAAVIGKEPDLGSAVVLGVICLSMMFAAGMRLTHLAMLAGAALVAGVFAVLAKPYRVNRMLAYLDPERDIHGSTYQIHQSLLAVSTGGLWGRGLGEGPQKYQFLSEGHTDFIYAVVCEELGMAGGLGVAALYAVFVFQGLKVARRAPDTFGALLAVGVTAMVGFQGFVNMAVVTGLLPTKGLTLPLVSYGGSSLVMNCVAVGILLNVSRWAEMEGTAPAAPGQRTPGRGGAGTGTGAGWAVSR